MAARRVRRASRRDAAHCAARPRVPGRNAERQSTLAVTAGGSRNARGVDENKPTHGSNALGAPARRRDFRKRSRKAARRGLSCARGLDDHALFFHGRPVRNFRDARPIGHDASRAFNAGARRGARRLLATVAIRGGFHFPAHSGRRHRRDGPKRRTGSARRGAERRAGPRVANGIRSAIQRSASRENLGALSSVRADLEPRWRDAKLFLAVGAGRFRALRRRASRFWMSPGLSVARAETTRSSSHQQSNAELLLSSRRVNACRRRSSSSRPPAGRRIGKHAFRRCSRRSRRPLRHDHERAATPPREEAAPCSRPPPRCRRRRATGRPRIIDNDLLGRLHVLHDGLRNPARARHPDDAAVDAPRASCASSG